jgi:hypothetical protein
MGRRLDASRLANARPIETPGPAEDAWPYAQAAELLADLALIRGSLAANRGARLAEGIVQAMMDQVSVFGFHLAPLDIRQDAAALRGPRRLHWRSLTDRDPLLTNRAAGALTRGSGDPAPRFPVCPVECDDRHHRFSAH